MTARPCHGSDELLVALVDGELDHATRERAQAHLLHCPGCHAEVESQRRLKARLRDLTSPTPSASLLSRLQALAPVEAPAPRVEAAAPDRSRPAGRPVSGAGTAPSAARPPGRVRSRRRTSTASALAVLSVGALLALAARPDPSQVTPATPGGGLVVTPAGDTGLTEQRPVQVTHAVLLP